MKRCLFVLQVLIFLSALAICSRVCDAQAIPKSAVKLVVLRGDNNQDLYFFATERSFDLSCQILSAGQVSVADAEAMRDGMIKIAAGTQAVELSRVNHFQKIKNEWLGKVRIQLSSGPQKGKQGYVFAKWVFPSKGKNCNEGNKDLPTCQHLRYQCGFYVFMQIT